MANDGTKYFEDYILRKEGRSKWIQYWVVIRGVWMLFYTDKATENRDNFRGSIELSSGTKCNIAKKANYSFPFYLNTVRGTHLFKCETNLKRHQWMYLIELASKGAPPVPAPLIISSSTGLQSTEDCFISPDTRSDLTESGAVDSEQDDDDLSIPPGVVLVTTAIGDLSRSEKVSRADNVSTPIIDPSLINRAVLATGIGGATVVIQDTLSCPAALKHGAETLEPKTSHSFQSIRAKLAPHRTTSNPPSLTGGLRPLSAQQWDRGNPERPSSSPCPSPTFDSKFSAKKLTPRPPASSSLDKTRFSRHMATSAPDIQILSLEETSR